MAEKRKLARWLDGTVFAIPLGDGTQVFGRLLKRPLMAFYDWRTDHLPPLEEILSRPVLFKVHAHHTALLQGEWPVVGRHKLEPELTEEPSFYIQDALSGRFSLYRGGQERPATREEIEGLECAAVWAPNHLVDRLVDHYAGRKNVWLESMRPKDSV